MEEAVKYKALINDTEVEVVLTETGDGVTAEIDGRRYQLQIRNQSPGDYLILNEVRGGHGVPPLQHVYQCDVEPSPASRNQFEVQLRGKRHSITVLDPRRLRVGENSDRHHDGPTEIVAQMPGKVVRVLVEVGEKVAKGAGLLVVEAMKMQNEMKSPRDGVVVSVNVQPGETVNAGGVLATVGDGDE